MSIDIVETLSAFRARLPTLPVTTKPDRSLLSQADLEMETRIVRRLQFLDPTARILAEESGTGAWRPEGDEVPERMWVVDPIDGTAEFLRGESREYCSALALLEHGTPTWALIVAPELGRDRTPLVIAAEAGGVTVNGAPAGFNSSLAASKQASVTRSMRTTGPLAFDATLRAAGYSLKTRATSQVLDMVRTAIDLTEAAGDPIRFDVFHRLRQKLWDGVAGLLIGEMNGLLPPDGPSPFPLTARVLASDVPTFERSLMGRTEAVAVIERTDAAGSMKDR
ncbi:inositol monophosphatase family protein [Phytomonospora sp. NPDC050363]|uniref:inositol monophosphatase family protein n=1 Tax=Phytomonospora sp. NPDC050363 TaxID=3155642 RepID=UPI0033DD98D2